MRLDEIERLRTFPTKTFKKLYHIGSLRLEDKGQQSQEGAGLTVTTHPEEWSAISEMITGALWEASKPNNRFLNMYKLSKKHKQSIIDWGVENGYVKTKAIYRVEYYDGDLDMEVYQEYDSREEAEEENDPKDIEEIRSGLVATSRLTNRTNYPGAGPTIAFDLLTTVFVEDATQLDGVWWEDRLDVSVYSAPRGVIVPSRVSSWTFKKIKESI